MSARTRINKRLAIPRNWRRALHRQEGCKHPHPACHWIARSRRAKYWWRQYIRLIAPEFLTGRKLSKGTK